MKEKVNQYKFDRIGSIMQKEFGKIIRGEEEGHELLLFPMEGNMLKLYREDHKRNGRRAKEAVNICLLTIDGYLTGKEYDTTAVAASESEELAHGLLMSFDPFTNEEIRQIVEGSLNLDSVEELRKYFEEPVICLIRIEKSIELWTKKMGPEGYFLFLEQSIGITVEDNLEMDYTVEVSEGIFEKPKKEKGLLRSFFSRR